MVVFWLYVGHNTTLLQRYLESTFLRCHNVNLQRCDNQNTTLLQRSHNVILFAGNLVSTMPVCVSKSEGHRFLFRLQVNEMNENSEDVIKNGCEICHSAIIYMGRIFEIFCMKLDAKTAKTKH